MDNYSVVGEASRPTRRLVWSRVKPIILAAIIIFLCMDLFSTIGYFIGLLLSGGDWKQPNNTIAFLGYIFCACLLGFGIVLGVLFLIKYDYVCPMVPPRANLSSVSSTDSSSGSDSPMGTGQSQEV